MCDPDTKNIKFLSTTLGKKIHDLKEEEINKVSHGHTLMVPHRESHLKGYYNFLQIIALISKMG
jgi:hypothetical protein